MVLFVSVKFTAASSSLVESQHDPQTKVGDGNAF